MRKLIYLLVFTVFVTNTTALTAKEDPDITSKLEAACKKHERSPIIPVQFISTTIQPEGRQLYQCGDLNGVDDEDERYFRNACKNTAGYGWVTHGREDELHTGQCVQIDLGQN